MEQFILQVSTLHHGNLCHDDDSKKSTSSNCQLVSGLSDRIR
jgi:hypothetical protein